MDVLPTDIDAAVVALIAACGLPIDDLHTPIQRARVQALAAREGREPVGVIGVEPAGQYGLVRSLAVHPAHRRRGLAAALLDSAERRARDQGLVGLYLLATTAEAFFRARGYEPLPREAASPPIRDSTQFSAICPGSAAFLGRAL